MSYWSQHFIKPSVHNLVLCMSLCGHSLYLTLWDPMDCSPSGSSVHGISQARILEWIDISFSRGSSRPRDRNFVSCISCISRWLLRHCATWEAISLFKDNLFHVCCWFLHIELMGKSIIITQAWTKLGEHTYHLRKAYHSLRVLSCTRRCVSSTSGGNCRQQNHQPKCKK